MATYFVESYKPHAHVPSILRIDRPTDWRALLAACQTVRRLAQTTSAECHYVVGSDGFQHYAYEVSA